jgi:GNAT superfamily N-acetyltransferase
MNNWTISEELPRADEYNDLRAAAGWRTFAPPQAAAGLRGSLYCLCARSDGRLVGMGRVVGDGAICFYLQDVLVRPEFQGRGIGSALVSGLLKYLRQRADGEAIVRLMAAPGAAKFYERFGFLPRPADGPGMELKR